MHYAQNNDPQEENESHNVSETSQLFAALLSEQTAEMDEEQAAAFLSAFFDDGGEIEAEQLFERLVSDDAHPFQITSYHPDTAVREASLASKNQWKTTLGGEIAYLASNSLEVYLRSQGEPLEVGEALTIIRKLNESTVLTARIALGLWNSRQKTLAKNGSVPILLEEILQWQGHEKRSRLAHPETDATTRYSDGFRSQQKQRVVQDMAALGSCYVRGSCTLEVGGKSALIEVNGPYLHHSLVFRRTHTGDKALIGFMVAPGDWIATYEQRQVESLARIDKQIFTLNPHNDRYALRLALYLTERWREQAKTGTFSTPIAMTDLLAASMIEINKQHLTTQMAPGIETALTRLEEMHIIGKQLCLNTVDKTQTRWGKTWLAARWEILPPIDLIQAYKPTGIRGKRVRKEEKRTTPPGLGES